MLMHCELYAEHRPLDRFSDHLIVLLDCVISAI
uniref:Uncharacterized protein n=1 Tax=Populus trichocarpa TaxID=3694 RepID=A0A3N7FVJ9_POPTR